MIHDLAMIRNIGIIARQRGQVLAFFLCFIVYLGWDDQAQQPNDEIIAIQQRSAPRQLRSRP